MTPALSACLATASTFWVTVQKTEAAERCHLQGTYLLKASRDSLVLGDPHSKQPLFTWPYRLLRRYGRDKVGLGIGQEGQGRAGWGQDWPMGELFCSSERSSWGILLGGLSVVPAETWALLLFPRGALRHRWGAINLSWGL